MVELVKWILLGLLVSLFFGVWGIIFGVIGIVVYSWLGSGSKYDHYN